MMLSGWIDWIYKKEGEFRSFLNLPTNKYDVRNYIPGYLKEFARPYSDLEKQNPEYRKIFFKPPVEPRPHKNKFL